jgi:hypothetical protein
MAAYAYFDENGNLLEFISDRTLRQGNSEGVNKIYVFMEPEDFNYADKSLRCTYKDINTNTIYDTTIGSILDHIVSKTLPTFKDYDPTHFVSGKTYPFIEITVPGAVMELEGSKVLSLAMDQLVEDTEDDPQYEPYLIYQSVITFYVNESVIQYTETISKSQYDYLLSLIGSVDAKIYDKSKTIFKAANRTELGSASQWSDGQVLLVISDSSYSNHMTLLIKQDNSYSLLYDFNDHYTKAEVNAIRDTLQGNINALNNSKQDKLVRDSLPTAQLQYVVGFDANGNLRKGAGGGGGGATYEAGYGILIDSANYIISADIGVLATKLDLESYATVSSVSSLSGRVSTIEGLIPAQATSENQLADKNFVNSSIATNTANFIGTFNNVTALNNYSGTVTNNDYANVINQELDFATTTEMNAYNKALLTNYDYAWVVNGTKYDLYRFDIEEQTWGLRATNIAKTDISLITVYNRYTYNSALSQWKWNYSINTSGFTAAQWAAINSGITAGIVSDVALKSGNNTFTGSNIFNNFLRTEGGVGTYASNIGFIADGFIPNENGTRDWGSSSRQLKDIYFAGKLFSSGKGFDYDTIGFPKINIPSSTTLTDLTPFQNGCKIIGSWTLGSVTLVNPVFYPCSLRNDRYLGKVIYTDNDDKGKTIECAYTINSSNVISLYNASLASFAILAAQGKTEINGETYNAVSANPTVPSGTTPTDLTGLKVGSNYYDIQSVKTQSTGGATSIQLKTWVGTQAQYDSITTKDANTQYIII